MSKVILIHGAGATRLSWVTFRDACTLPAAFFEYDSTRPLSEIVDKACEMIQRKYGLHELSIVGHSLGGVIAWHVAQKLGSQIKSAVSIASPWGGSAWADTISLFASFIGQNFFANIGRSQPHLVAPRKKPVPCSWLNVIATRGIIQSPENDGVLTVSSQEALFPIGVLEKRVHHSHGEVVHAKEVIRVVEEFLVKTS